MQADDVTLAWKPLGSVAPSELWDARVQLHWAAQIPAAIGEHLVPAREDFAHTSFGWLDDRHGFATLWAEQGAAVSGGLSIRDFTAIVDNDEGTRSLSLSGKTLAEGQAWLAEQLSQLGTTLPGSATISDDMPAHPVGTSDQPFTIAESHLQEMANWYANADRMMVYLEGEQPGSGDVRVWPHHLDLAMLIAIDRDPTTGSSIGVGLAPGDDLCKEFYYYVRMNAAQGTDATLPSTALSHGSWHQQSPMAILRGSEIVGAGDTSEAQAGAVYRFCKEAIDACRDALGDKK